MKIAVVGAGLYGATVAHMCASKGHDVMVFERETQVGGNIRSHWEPKIGSHVSDFGAHIFHTNSERVWAFVNQFATFNQYKHYVKGLTEDQQMIDLPFGMSMFNQILGLTSPAQARTHFKHVKASGMAFDQSTIEGWCLANIGSALYKTAIKHYTERQWGRPCSELPASIVQRLPLRFTYDTTYFHNATWQGMPIGGYSSIIARMLDSSRIKLRVDSSIDYGDVKDMERLYDRVYFSGMIDELMDYQLGVLEYRGLEFRDRLVSSLHGQGAPVINELGPGPKHSRVIEHRLFYPGAMDTGWTLQTEEFPTEWKRGDRAYYPLRNEDSLALYSKYEAWAQAELPKTKFGGRLGSFSYLDMDQAIGMALAHVKDIV